MKSITETFNGLPIVFREDGYINMTKAAKHFGKRPAHFLELPGSKEYMEALGEILNVGKSDLWVSTKGRYGATFLHPKLAVFFARWLDVRFAVWCDLMIDNILKGNLQVSVANPTKEVLTLKAQLDDAQARILGLEGEVQRLQEMPQE